MSNEVLQQAIKDVSFYIRLEVAGGFMPLDRIVSRALSILAREYDIDELRPHAQEALEECVAEHMRQEKTWPAFTDCDRLDAAFADLEAQGIVCRQNFSCCGTCASGEILDEIEAERARGREIVGCAHYDVQGTEGAVRGHGVWLSYGSVLEGERASVDIGHQVVRAIQARGLKARWNGRLSDRIHVRLDWKRRLRTAMPSGN